MHLRGLVLNFAVVIGVAAGVAGCASPSPDAFFTSPITGSTLPASAPGVEDAQKKFTEGHFGLAVDGFAQAVETDPLNSEAWLGLAASYDQVGRFDQADKAYTKVQELIGPTPSVLNNLGYSYLMRGNLERSRETLTAAYRGDPGNPFIVNNIEILNEKLTTLGQPVVPLN